MTIELTWFSVHRERVGKDQETVEFEGGTARDLYARLDALHGFHLPARNLRVAVNDVFADWDLALADRDHVVFIAPVGGG